jgi:hypothetical protein
MAETPFSKRCEILGRLWIEYRGEEEFDDFIEYNDIGLPFAYIISNDLGEPTKTGKAFINETWDLFLGTLGIKEDTGFETLDDVLEAS